MLRSYLSLPALSLTLFACADQEAWEPREIADQGDLCLEAPVADAEATVVVQFDECFSSNCDRRVEGSCTATLEGSSIMVHSTLTWETQTNAEECNDDCLGASASCSVGPLPSGGFTLDHGTASDFGLVWHVPTDEPCQVDD